MTSTVMERDEAETVEAGNYFLDLQFEREEAVRDMLEVAIAPLDHAICFLLSSVELEEVKGGEVVNDNIQERLRHTRALISTLLAKL